MTNGVTIEDVGEQRGVEAVVHDAVNQSPYLVVRPYGNSVLFNNLARSSHLRLQNVAIIRDGRYLKVNIKPIGPTAQ